MKSYVEKHQIQETQQGLTGMGNFKALLPYCASTASAQH